MEDIHNNEAGYVVGEGKLGVLKEEESIGVINGGGGVNNIASVNIEIGGIMRPMNMEESTGILDGLLAGLKKQIYDESRMSTNQLKVLDEYHRNVIANKKIMVNEGENYSQNGGYVQVREKINFDNPVDFMISSAKRVMDIIVKKAMYVEPTSKENEEVKSDKTISMENKLARAGFDKIRSGEGIEENGERFNFYKLNYGKNEIVIKEYEGSNKWSYDCYTKTSIEQLAAIDAKIKGVMSNENIRPRQIEQRREEEEYER